MRSVAVAALGAAACVLSIVTPAAADVVVNVSKSTQRMAVLVNGSVRYNWTVSTGKRGYGTPTGVYQPERLERFWRSRKYGNAPMPYSVFYYKGYAIHGTTELKQLGRIASHGCVRLHPANAAVLFDLVKMQGKENTRITVFEGPLPVVEPPKSEPLVAENEAGAQETRAAREIRAEPEINAQREAAASLEATAPRETREVGITGALREASATRETRAPREKLVPRERITPQEKIIRRLSTPSVRAVAHASPRTKVAAGFSW
jgi:hypothetical protein